MNETMLKELIKDLKGKAEHSTLFDRNTLLYVINKLENKNTDSDIYGILDMKAKTKYDLDYIEDGEHLYKIRFSLAPMVTLHARYGGTPTSIDAMFYFEEDPENLCIMDGEYDINNMFDEIDLNNKLIPSLYTDCLLYFKPLLSLFKEEDYERLNNVVIEVDGNRDDEDNTWSGPFAEFRMLSEKNFGIKPPHNYDT